MIPEWVLDIYDTSSILPVSKLIKNWKDEPSYNEIIEQLVGEYMEAQNELDIKFI